MPQIQTATGPIDTSQLGTTLAHEHVQVRRMLVDNPRAIFERQGAY